jgi:NodT family efflux transporter outer membrane factor (OMF) lipoprotein
VASVALRTLLFALVLLDGCSFAPKYSRPTVETPPTYKEGPATNPPITNLWKLAEPKDQLGRGAWWQLFDDPQLNSLEEQVSISNQNVAAAFANYLVARAQVREARAQLFPTLVASPSVTRAREGSFHTSPAIQGAATTFTTYSLPLDGSWQPDFWGRTRNTIKATAYEAQATLADLENTRLLSQAELATDLFQLRAQDALEQIYEETVRAYRESYNLTVARFQTGIASNEDVALAETQLRTAEAQATNLLILRAQLEHAIALLIGKPASSFSLAVNPTNTVPPAVPFGLLSELLERRPDIGAAERRVAEANAQIGVAKAAYFPTISLTASGGFESTALTSLVDWPSRFWSIGAGLSETVFDAGLRHATVQQYQAAYQGTVAQYRQTVLTAFQQVEDNLSGLRALFQQVRQQEAAVQSAQQYLNLALDRYQLGIDSYLNVIVAQTALLNNRQALVNARNQSLTSTVQLVQALGGGWEQSQLPATRDVIWKMPADPESVSKDANRH